MKRWGKFPPIVITGCGLVCSLGLDVETVCAAIRAGMVRPSSIDTFIVGDRDDSGGATVHAAPLITHGFEGEARILRLIQAALVDFLSQQPEAIWENASIGFYLSLPVSDRPYTGLVLIPDDDLRQQEIEKSEQMQAIRVSPVDEKARAQRLLQKAASLSGWTIPVNLQRVSTSGHTGVAELIEFACHDLATGTVEMAIVGGVDSLIDESSLTWLERSNRLKSPTMPVGLPPGEASGFLLLETASHSNTRSAQSLATLLSVFLDQDSNPQLTGNASTGEALANVISRSAKLAGWSSSQPPWLIVDQNGESYRAMEWGCALSRLVKVNSAFQDSALWYPVASVGDAGAATGAVQTSVAAQAIARGYAPSVCSALLSSAEGGQRACALLGAPDG